MRTGPGGSSSTALVLSVWRRALTQEWRRFALAATLVAITCAAFLVWQKFRFGGDQVTIAIDDIGEGVAAGIAAISLAVAAIRSTGRMRLAWGLLGAGAASWCIGEAIWSWYEVFQKMTVPSPSAADAGFLLEIPLALAGVLALTTAPSRLATRGEAVLAGAIVALSLLFIALSLGLRTVYDQSQQSQQATFIGLAYPIGDIVIITVLMIALAPLWPSPAVERDTQEGAITLWQLALPWAATLAAAAVALKIAASNQGLDQLLTALAGGIGVLFVANQVLTHRDSLDLLTNSRNAELQLEARTSLLNQVIVQAPLGIARVGVDMKIIDANPRLAVLLRTKPADMIGHPVAQFLPPEEMQRVVRTFQPLWNGAVDTIESDSSALRVDGSSTWLHWSASSIKRPGGRTDFFLVMFEDASAEHMAQEAAMANLAGLERLSQLKSEFVSLVSHEFRTALVGIQGFSEMIRDQDLTPVETKSFAGDINNDALRLNRMITEMLDLDRIEAGRMTLNIASVDLNAILDDAVERARASSH